MKPLIELRSEGLYCPAGDFHIDPWRPVPRAVITHGHGDHARGGSGEYHCAGAGLPILRWRLGEQDYHPRDYGEPFGLGAARVTLFPAGHILGSAQVRIEANERTWVVSGDYKRDPDPTCAPFEVVPCDGFLTEATFALPVYRWSPTPEVAAEIIEWWDQCRAQERTAVLFCYALGKAQRLLAELAALLPPACRSTAKRACACWRPSWWPSRAGAATSARRWCWRRPRRAARRGCAGSGAPRRPSPPAG